AEGIRLAIERREEMRRLLRENPEGAFAKSLSWNEWAALPKNVQDLVEQPFSRTVDFQVLPNCPPREGAVNNIHSHQIVIDGEAHDAFVYGSNALMTSKEGMPARGFLLDGLAVLADQPFERLAGENLKAALGIFQRGAPEGVSWVSGQPLGPDAR